MLPGGGNALDVVLTLLTMVFLAAIAFLGYRMYRQYRVDIETLEPNVRLVLYGSVGLAILTFVGTDRLFDSAGSRSSPGLRCWRSARTGSTGPGSGTAATASRAHS